MSKIDFSYRPGEDDDSVNTRNTSWRAREEANDEMRRVIGDYLQPGTALTLDQAIEQVAPCYIDDGRMVLGFHYTVIDLADKIPYHHPSHRKLAEFVTAFRESGEWWTQSQSRGQNQWSTREQAVGNFDGELGIYLYDEAMKTPDDWAENTGDPMIYANMHAFLAELSWPDEPFAFFWARVALDRAFEETQPKSAQSRDAQVIGAAQYILRQAAIIHSESVKTRRPIQKSVSQKVNDFCSRFRRKTNQQAPNFTWERWQAWSEGFRAVAANETMYSQTSRDIAERAADKMALQVKADHDKASCS